MTQFGEVWKFTRARLGEALEGLSDVQLAWRLYPEAHTISEMTYHLAGVEHYYASRLAGKDPAATPFEALLEQAVFAGFLKPGMGGPFHAPQYLTAEALSAALEYTAREIGPIIESPTPEQLAQKVVSALGVEIAGSDALVRIAQHPAYHCGQIWMVAMSSDFPTK